MWRAKNCPGSMAGMGEGKSEDGDEGRVGRELHGLVEKAIGVGIPPGLVEPENSWVEECIWRLKEIGGGPWETEKLLFVLAPNGDLVASCRADAILVTEDQANIVDWKFYHEELEAEERQWQMTTMLVAVLQEYPYLPMANCTVYYPILGRTYPSYLTRVALPRPETELREIHAAVNQPNPPLRPGPWCARCRLLARCPAALGSVEKIAGGVNLAKLRGSGGRLPTVEAMEEKFWDKVSCWSPARLRGAAQLLPLLAPLASSIKRALRRDLEEDAGSHPEWELKRKRGKAQAKFPGEVVAEAEVYLSHQEILDCTAISVAKIRDLIAGGFRDLPKHEARAKAERILAPYVTREETTELRRRK